MSEKVSKRLGNPLDEKDTPESERMLWINAHHNAQALLKCALAAVAYTSGKGTSPMAYDIEHVALNYITAERAVLNLRQGRQKEKERNADEQKKKKYY